MTKVRNNKGGKLSGRTTNNRLKSSQPKKKTSTEEMSPVPLTAENAPLYQAKFLETIARNLNAILVELREMNGRSK